MAWCPPEAQAAWFVLQVDRPRLLKERTNAAELCNKIANAVFPTKVGGFIPRISVVGEDIDPTNLIDVIWVEATRCEPAKQEFTFPHEFPTYKLLPFVSQRDPADKTITGKTIRCCMLPEEFTDEKLQFQEMSFKGSYPENVKSKVLENWTTYGFKEQM
jgi:UbiD family decarboxylase